jgi:hypothetical protein
MQSWQPIKCGTNRYIQFRIRCRQFTHPIVQLNSEVKKMSMNNDDAVQGTFTTLFTLFINCSSISSMKKLIAI